MFAAQDRAKIDERWNAFAQAWFPDGVDDPHLALVRIDVDRAQYWDDKFDRLSALGVQFTQPPTPMGPVTTADFDDTCGNLIQIAEMQRA